jgi:hypothetical protein
MQIVERVREDFFFTIEIFHVAYLEHLWRGCWRKTLDDDAVSTDNELGKVPLDIVSIFA